MRLFNHVAVEAIHVIQKIQSNAAIQQRNDGLVGSIIKLASNCGLHETYLEKTLF